MTGNPILCNNEIQNFHVNRSYKDCLFRMIFSDSRVLQELPFPQYIVFYNGTTAAPERQTLCLTQAFKKYPEKTPCLECKAVLLNINYGKNQKIMKHCRKLKEYALFVNKMRSFLKKGLSVEISAQKTISECISQHILEDFLVKHRAEVTSCLLYTSPSPRD